MTGLAVCDECGGPAWWTILDGEVYYKCQRPCDDFTKALMLVDLCDTVDKVVSVGALVEERSE